MTLRKDRELAGEQVKALVLNWLAQTNVSLTDFEQLLEAEYPSTDEQTLIYGELDEALNFEPLTEEQMIHKSLEALSDYRRTGNGISHVRVRKWVDSLGRDCEL